MRALLDVNVLIALLDAAHMHHARATQWLQQEIAHGWASCPLTQNGCLRIMAQPAYPQALALAAVASRLAQATAHPAHTFVPDDYSLLDAKQLHGSTCWVIGKSPTAICWAWPCATNAALSALMRD